MGNRQVGLTDTHPSLKDRELWLHNVYISAYSYARNEDLEQVVPTPLLMHRREIDRLEGKIRHKGPLLVPTRIYVPEGRIKCELALAKGKQVHDKRDAKRKAIEESEAREAAFRRRSRNIR